MLNYVYILPFLSASSLRIIYTILKKLFVHFFLIIFKNREDNSKKPVIILLYKNHE